MLRAVVNPGGRLVFGAEFWQRPPTPGQLANMWPGSSAEDCTDLAGLVDRAVVAGFRPLRIETVTTGEWDEPQADEVRTRLDTQRGNWLRGHRDVLGFAYLTLGAGPGGVGGHPDPPVPG